MKKIILLSLCAFLCFQYLAYAERLKLCDMPLISASSLVKFKNAGYTISDSPRAYKRFLAPIQRLRTEMTFSTNMDKTIAHMLEVDTRGAIFRAESLLRLYSGESKKFKELLNSVKQLEDSLGAYSASKDYLEFAQKVSADPRVLAFMQKKEADDLLRLKKEISSWASDGKSDGLDRFQYILAHQKWMNMEKDRAILARELYNEMIKVHNAQLDMAELQKGVHELRRKTRWFPIYTQSLQGMLNFYDGAGKCTIKSYNALLNTPLETSKYVLFDISKEEIMPIRISKPYYLKMSQTVGNLGKIKDNGEYFESLTEAYVNAGIYTDHHRAYEHVIQLAKKQNIVPQNFEKEAGEIYHEIQDNKLFKRVADELKVYFKD